MKNKYLKSVTRYITNSTFYHYFNPQKSYSQEGEDLVLNSFFEDYPRDYKGFYVDIGAYDPVRFSNTFFFYSKGWKGINIEPTYDKFKKLKQLRRRDINLNIAINNSSNNKKLNFYMFNEPALNTFNEERALELQLSSDKYKLKAVNAIEVTNLSELLNKYNCPGAIDFFNIDCEGVDLQVLEGNDWNKYKPDFIMIEDANFDIDKIDQNEIFQFLKTKKYDLIAKTKRTTI